MQTYIKKEHFVVGYSTFFLQELEMGCLVRRKATCSTDLIETEDTHNGEIM